MSKLLPGKARGYIGLGKKGRIYHDKTQDLYNEFRKGLSTLRDEGGEKRTDENRSR